MANPGQPTVRQGDSGDVVRRAQRGVRRTPNLGLVVDGIFGHETEKAIKQVQKAAGLAVDGIVGPATWQALPDGGPMPMLSEGSTGAVVHHLQTVLKNGSSVWGTGPGAIDGDFGPKTRDSVEAFQKWGGVGVDGIVGEQTWDVSLHAMSATLETQVGLQFVIG
jgi:peptidoglycan hydrolase-like protein with peptidoglycan-binding domain